jgi:hypothetical protein
MIRLDVSENTVRKVGSKPGCITREFDCPEMPIDLLHRLIADTGTVNKSKIGRQRRGTMFFIGVDYLKGRLTMRWAAIRGMKETNSKRAVPLYRYADHGKLLATVKGVANQ